MARDKATAGKGSQKRYKAPEGTNGVKIIPDGDEWVIVGEPLYRTADQRIVHENDVDGRWLAYPKGVRILRTEAVRMGFLSDNEPKSKARKPEENK